MRPMRGVRLAALAAMLAAAGTVAGCTDPYDPGQRAAGGGLLGAGARVRRSAGSPAAGVARWPGRCWAGRSARSAGAATTPEPPPPPPVYYQPAPQPPPYYGY